MPSGPHTRDVLNALRARCGLEEQLGRYGDMVDSNPGIEKEAQAESCVLRTQAPRDPERSGDSRRACGSDVRGERGGTPQRLAVSHHDCG